MAGYDEVLNFWFSGELLGKEQMNRWWQKDKQVDEWIKKRFETLVDNIYQGLYKNWSQTPKGCLAAIICLDQFPRNMYRGDLKAFEYDALALSLVQKGLELEYELALNDLERTFFILPLMHHENTESQVLCLQLYEQLAQNAEDEVKSYLSRTVIFAKKHLEIIERFGRFPHRNKVLGRECTEEEIEFLTRPGSSF